MKCTLGSLGWGACKKPRYGYYTRHAAHHGHAPSPFPRTGKRRRVSYRRSLSCQPKGQSHYATYGAPVSCAHLPFRNGGREVKLATTSTGTCTRTKMLRSGRKKRHHLRDDKIGYKTTILFNRPDFVFLLIRVPILGFDPSFVTHVSMVR